MMHVASGVILIFPTSGRRGLTRCTLLYLPVGPGTPSAYIRYFVHMRESAHTRYEVPHGHGYRDTRLDEQIIRDRRTSEPMIGYF